MFGKCGIGGWCTSFYNLETDDYAATWNHPNADQGFEHTFYLSQTPHTVSV